MILPSRLLNQAKTFGYRERKAKNVIPNGQCLQVIQYINRQSYEGCPSIRVSAAHDDIIILAERAVIELTGE
jgi:hypothetical protein